jgi:hypothetical protein
MKTIHTFGDSHCSHGWDKVNIPNVKINIHYLGGRLMYTFGENKFLILNISDKNYNVKETDYVCFCFGEIDCRCHLDKYKEDYFCVIERLVKNYIDAITINIEQFKEVTPIIYNVLPTFKILNTSITKENQYPHLGTNEERKKYTIYMNSCLKKKCQEFGYIYFDVYNQYCSNDGFLKKELSNNVHIDDPVFLEEFIRGII